MSDSAARRHVRFYGFLRKVIKPYLRVKFCYNAVPAPQLEGPYFVLANHTTDYDPFMVALSFPQHMYFLASEHVYRMGFVSRLLGYFLAPIARVKGGSDLSAVMDMLRTIRKGHSICFFPEGSRTFNGESCPMTAAAAKLVRKAGVPVVTYRLTGGYLTSPRWAKELRKGKVTGQVVRVYSAEEVQAMEPEALADAFNRDLYVNAFADQKALHVPYACSAPAEGLEEALYLCPRCHTVGHLRGIGSRFLCDCGFSCRLDEYGFFQAEGKTEVPFDDILSWDRWQQDELRKLLPGSTETPFFSDPDFVLNEVDGEHAAWYVCSGTLSLYADHLTIGDSTFALTDLSGLAIIHSKGAESLVFSQDTRHFELSSQTNASRSKYYILYHMLTDSLQSAAKAR